MLVFLNEFHFSQDHSLWNISLAIETCRNQLLYQFLGIMTLLHSILSLLFPHLSQGTISGQWLSVDKNSGAF
jgi:hypothetical protein